MNLHINEEQFKNLITLTAQDKHIPESAVYRDYFIVRSLMQAREGRVDNKQFRTYS